MPAGVIHEFPGIISALIHRVLPAHLDVAAKRNGIDPVIRFALAEANEPLAESNGELLDAHPEPFGHGVVAELVDQDHEAEDGNHRNHGNQKIIHSRGTTLPPIRFSKLHKRCCARSRTQA